MLLVEDEAALAEVVTELLTDHGHTVDHAADAPQAIAAAAAAPYDLILLDWTLPSATGGELLERWRAQGLTARVLALSGDEEVASRLGSAADGFLTKPFSFSELLARVAAFAAELPRQG